MAALAALWSLSLLAMVMGTLDRGEQIPWLAWGVYLGVAACVPTGWWVVDSQCRRNRIQVEHLAQIMAAEAQRQYNSNAEIHSIR